MSSTRAKRKPGFFWQGLLVLLPVALLAAVGLVSLRRDELAAEQEARSRAAENVQALARAVRSTVNDELHQFLALEQTWGTELRPPIRQLPVINRPAGPELPDVQKWERTHPGLKLAELVTPKSVVSSDGRTIQPPEIPIAPEPPQWYRELSAGQRGLWQALRQAQDDRASPATIQSAYQAFVASNPGTGARQAAVLLQHTPEQVLEGGLDPVATESGVSFQEVACYRLLRDSQPPLTRPLVEAVRRVTEATSFGSPTLLDLAEGLSARAEPAILDELRRTRQSWEGHVRLRAWRTALREWPELKAGAPQAPRAYWVWSEFGEALAILEPTGRETTAAGSAGSLAQAPGCTVWFVPRQVVEAILAKALRENGFLIPEYADVWLSVEGMRLLTREAAGENRPMTPAPFPPEGETPNASHGDAGRAKPLLASASQRFGRFAAADAGTFEIKFFLASREKMLANEQRRTSLFVGLIAASSLVAVFGLGAAYRAFHRQLQLNEMKSNFVSSVSHELRAPIASVRLMAESLERGRISEPPKQQEYFRFIGQECRRLSALIENVLDFSRIEQGRKQYEFEPTDLLALTRETVTLMATYAAERQIGLQLSLDQHRVSTDHYQLSADGKALQQALVNLIDNAIKHSPKGATATVGLEVRGPESDDRSEEEGRGSSVEGRAAVLALWVEDCGEGIPPEEHEKIFERFYRLGSELRRETQGVGIGLSIVKHVVETHGGRVRVRSALGQGSRFTIELPRAAPDSKSETQNSKPEWNAS